MKMNVDHSNLKADHLKLSQLMLYKVYHKNLRRQDLEECLNKTLWIFNLRASNISLKSKMRPIQIQIDLSTASHFEEHQTNLEEAMEPVKD